MKGRRDSRQARAAALEAAREIFVAWGRKGGQKRTQQLTAAERKAVASAGAAARWKGISPAERSKILQKAARARWAKVKKVQPKKRK